MIDAYRLLADTVDHPLHLGVTEAGPPPQGLIKSVAGIGTLLSNRADIIVAGLFFGPAATGIYRLAARLPDVLVEATVRSLQQVALPSLSRLQGDRVAFAAHLTRLQHFGAALGLPALGILAATASPLVAVLGPQWSGTETPMRLLCLYAAANVYRVLLGPALQAIGRPARLAAVIGPVTVVASPSGAVLV